MSADLFEQNIITLLRREGGCREIEVQERKPLNHLTNSSNLAGTDVHGGTMALTDRAGEREHLPAVNKVAERDKNQRQTYWTSNKIVSSVSLPSSLPFSPSPHRPT